MGQKNIANEISEFAQDVLVGLSSHPKKLSSKYFYDSNGDKIFQQIMDLDEYYLTRIEHEILSKHKEEILDIFNHGNESFDLIELGAGDGYKTKVLLEYFSNKNVDFSYMPVDISSHVLNILVNTLRGEFPDLKVKGLCDEYFNALEKLEGVKRRKAILFQGANIGNFEFEDAVFFLQELYNCLNPGDLVMIGFDLKKEPSTILDAYNDKNGITSSFNLNLLRRINAELGGNFNLGDFSHFPIYCPVSGDAKSFLVSRKKQKVFIEKLGLTFDFEAFEAVQTELSKKYDLKSVEEMAAETGFQIVKNFQDGKNSFLDTIWRKN